MGKKSFFRFVKKLLFILIPVYALWYFYIEFMPLYYNQANNTRWYFMKECLNGNITIPKSGILFLGESRVNAAVNFNEIPNSWSLASGGSTPIEMYYALTKYSKYICKPDTVFLSISPRFLSEIFAFYPYAVRNDFFNYSEFKEICNFLPEKDTTLGSVPMIKYFLYKFNYIGYYQSDVLNNFVLGAVSENKKLIEEMKKLNGGRYHPELKDSCSDLNYETKYKHFTPSPILDIYFEKILSFCRKEGIYLIFDFIPVNESSYNNFNPLFTADYKNYMKRYKNEYPEFNVSDNIYYYKDEFFGDESHLNSKGKRKYTNYLKEKYFK